jgi:hypothetical protein
MQELDSLNKGRAEFPTNEGAAIMPWAGEISIKHLSIRTRH